MNALAAIPDTSPALSNLDAEQGVLGTLLLNKNAIDSVSFLQPNHFSEPVHAAIYGAMVERRKTGQAATILTLGSDLPAFRVGDLGPQAYLAHLAASTWTTSEVAGTARELVALSAKRRLIALGNEMRSTAAAPGMKASDIIAAVETDLIQLSEEIGRLNATNEVEAADIIAEIGARMASGRHFKGVECGLDAIDRRLGGFAPGELIVIAGRPGMGKTALGLSMARRAAHVGCGVAFDTIEMTKASLWHRLLSDEALMAEPISYKAIGRGKLTPAQFDAVKRANARLVELPLVIIDRGNRLSDLPAHIRAARRALAKRGKKLDILIIDYLGLLSPGDRYAGQKVNEVGEISMTLKALAKREGIAVIALHQLNRANENRSEDHRPRLSDLRDSGNLEQDADVVMFVYRESYYIERPGYRSFANEAEREVAAADISMKMDVIIAKQRQGEIASCELWCSMEHNAVRDGEKR